MKSAEYTFKDARDLVILAVGNAYLQAIADQARIEPANAQVNTAQALFSQAADQFLKEYEMITEGQRSPRCQSALNVAQVSRNGSAGNLLLCMILKPTPFHGVFGILNYSSVGTTSIMAS